MGILLFLFCAALCFLRGIQITLFPLLRARATLGYREKKMSLGEVYVSYVYYSTYIMITRSLSRWHSFGCIDRQPALAGCHAQMTDYLTHSSHPWCHCVHPPWGTVVALLLRPPCVQVAAGRAWSSLVYLICDFRLDTHPLGWFPGRWTHSIR